LSDALDETMRGPDRATREDPRALDCSWCMEPRARLVVVALAIVVGDAGCTSVGVSTPVNVQVVAAPVANASSYAAPRASDEHDESAAHVEPHVEPGVEPTSNASTSASSGVALPDADSADPQATCSPDFRCPSGSRFARIGSRGYCAVDGVSLPTPKTESYCAYLARGTLAFYWTTKDGDPAYVCPSGMRDSINGEATFCLWENLAPPDDARPECGELRAHGWIGFSWSCP
jgi:hypothetical protein